VWIDQKQRISVFGIGGRNGKSVGATWFIVRDGFALCDEISCAVKRFELPQSYPALLVLPLNIHFLVLEY